ncbi:MAG: O-acetylserine/cysteine exporter, partial [Hyphomicrobiales bacterium]
MPLRHILLALAVAMVWGVSFVAIRWGVDEVSPLLLTALRYVFAALPAVFFIKRPQVDWRVLVGYGLAIGVGQFGLLFIAIKLGMPAGLSSLVVQLQVFFTIFLAFLFFSERPNGWQVAGAAVAFAGIAVIALDRLDGAALLP